MKAMTIKEQISILEKQLLTFNRSRHRGFDYSIKRDRVNKKFIIMKTDVINKKTSKFSEPLSFEETKKMITGMKRLKFFFL